MDQIEIKVTTYGSGPLTSSEYSRAGKTWKMVTRTIRDKKLLP